MKEDSVFFDEDVQDSLFGYEEKDQSVQKKHRSNMTFKEKVSDWFCRMMEKYFAPGSYYLGRRAINAFRGFLREHPLGFTLVDERMSKLFIVLNKKNKDFGNDIVIAVSMGSVFSKSIRIVRFMGFKFYFFNPINLGDTGLKMALGMRCFFEDNTIVFGIKGMSDGFGAYRMNVPCHVSRALDSVDFMRKVEMGQLKEEIRCNIHSPYSPAMGYVKVEKVERKDSGDDIVELNISIEEKVLEFFPMIQEEDESLDMDKVEAGSAIKLARKDIAYMSRMVRGFKFVRSDKIGFLNDGVSDFGIAVGSHTLTMKKDVAESLSKALQALSEASDSWRGVGLGHPGEQMDEMYVGNEAIYCRWHRGWTNGKIEHK